MQLAKDFNPLFENHLLAALPRDEYQRLASHLELVRLTPGKIIYNVGDIVRHAYFPKGGMVSLLSTTETGKTIEVGMVGNEGIVGIPVILEFNVTPYEKWSSFRAMLYGLELKCSRRSFSATGIYRNYCCGTRTRCSRKSRNPPLAMAFIRSKRGSAVGCWSAMTT